MSSAAGFDARIVERLCAWMAREHGGGARVFGINGAQGSGKSTLARQLAAALRAHHALHAAVLSLDDLYLGKQERLRRAREVHPLLRTRGVPGTHDVALGIRLLSRLRVLDRGASLRLPVFVKARDARAPRGDWRTVKGPVDIVLFEGWCVGTPPQSAAALRHAVNALEREEDADGRWRRYVNRQLAGPYRAWFAAIDRLVFLAAPGFNAVLRWRAAQERDNVRVARSGRAMGATELARFVAHYERLTRHALRVLPRQADALLRLGPNHGVRRLSFAATLTRAHRAADRGRRAAAGRVRKRPV